MSVVIRGMKMPEDCPVCPLAHCNKLDRFTGCEIKKRYFDNADMETRGRPDFCPLVELPERHGRLIDADALTKMCREMQSIDWNKKASPYSWEHAYEEFENDIDEAPTIIEAEEVSE